MPNPHTWTLWLREALLGTFAQSNADQPSVFCRFQPTAEFEAVRPLFAAQAQHIEQEEYDELEVVQTQIDALGLALRRESDGALMDVSSLLIDGDAAEFIPIPVSDARAD